MLVATPPSFVSRKSPNLDWPEVFKKRNDFEEKPQKRFYIKRPFSILASSV
jgi:hypothetical protein